MWVHGENVPTYPEEGKYPHAPALARPLSMSVFGILPPPPAPFPKPALPASGK